MDDLRRRSELRDFLVAARSRLAPPDVGLPNTARRRVPGLRREEVAELAGVTPVWYRWFESGREMRVSEQFLERVSLALRLSAHDKVNLYRLALSGLYRADRAVRRAGNSSRSSLPPAAAYSNSAGAVLSDAEIERAAAADFAAIASGLSPTAASNDNDDWTSLTREGDVPSRSGRLRV